MKEECGWRVESRNIKRKCKDGIEKKEEKMKRLKG